MNNNGIHHSSHTHIFRIWFPLLAAKMCVYFAFTICKGKNQIWNFSYRRRSTRGNLWRLLLLLLFFSSSFPFARAVNTDNIHALTHVMRPCTVSHAALTRVFGNNYSLPFWIIGRCRFFLEGIYLFRVSCVVIWMIFYDVICKLLLHACLCKWLAVTSRGLISDK